MPFDLSSQMRIHNMEREGGQAEGIMCKSTWRWEIGGKETVVISGDKLESLLKKRKPVREIFSDWLLSKDYKKGDHIIYHLNWDCFRSEWECY